MTAASAAAGLRLSLPDEAALAAFAQRVAPHLRGGVYVALRGELGAGKTAFVRAVLRALGHAGVVRSPTFTLVERYTLAQFELLHLDLYRLADAREVESLGIRDCFGFGAVVMIEWPERAEVELPTADVELTFSYVGDGRAVAARAGSDSGSQLLVAIAAKASLEELP